MLRRGRLLIQCCYQVNATVSFSSTVVELLINLLITVAVCLSYHPCRSLLCCFCLLYGIVIGLLLQIDYSIFVIMKIGPFSEAG